MKNKVVFSLIVIVIFVVLAGCNPAPNSTPPSSTGNSGAISVPVVKDTLAPSPTSVPTLVSTSTTTPTAAEAEINLNIPALDILKVAYQNGMKAHSHHEESSSNINGTTLLSKLDLVSGGNMHSVSTSMNGKNTTTTELILVDGKYYKKTNEGAWADITDTYKKQQGDTGLLFTEETLNTIKDAKLMGQESLDGKPMVLITYSLDFMKVHFDNKAWIGMSDGLEYKIEMTYLLGNTPVTTTTLYSNYNADIKIESPIK